MQTNEEATVLRQRVGSILVNESPRGYASSFIARKALRWTRILIWVDQRSKTTSYLNGFRIQCNTEDFVPIVVPGLSARSSSSSSTSTPMTSSTEIDHSDHPPAIAPSESVDRQVRRDPYSSEIPEWLQEIQRESCGWQSSWTQTETDTQVLLMKLL